LGIAGALGWLIFQGKNWARWVFLVLTLYGFLALPNSIERLREHPAFDIYFHCGQMLLQLAASVGLLVKSSNRWFKANKSLDNPQ